MANIFDKKLKTASDSFKAQMLREPLILSKRKLKQLFPYFTGKAFWVATKKPAFLEKLAPEETTQFFNILQCLNIGVDGFGDDTVQFAEVAFGIPGQTMSIVTGVEDGTTSTTVKLPHALTGDPVTRYLMAWVYGTIDKNSGIGDYYGLVKDNQMDWSPENHICEWIYWVTDIGSTERGIEYSAYGFNQFPQTISKSHYNSTHGEVQHQPLNVTFRGQVIDNDENITDLAKTLMRKINDYRHRNIKEMNIQYGKVDALPSDRATDNNSM